MQLAAWGSYTKSSVEPVPHYVSDPYSINYDIALLTDRTLEQLSQAFRSRFSANVRLLDVYDDFALLAEVF